MRYVIKHIPTKRKPWVVYDEQARVEVSRHVWRRFAQQAVDALNKGAN